MRTNGISDVPNWLLRGGKTCAGISDTHVCDVGRDRLSGVLEEQPVYCRLTEAGYGGKLCERDRTDIVLVQMVKDPIDAFASLRRRAFYRRPARQGCGIASGQFLQDTQQRQQPLCRTTFKQKENSSGPRRWRLPKSADRGRLSRGGAVAAPIQ